MQREQLVVGLYVLTAPGDEKLAATIIMPIGMTKTNCKILFRPNVQNNDKCSHRANKALFYFNASAPAR
jgi:hypothetical protein